VRQLRRAEPQYESRRQQAEQEGNAPELLASRRSDRIAEDSTDAGDAPIEQQQYRGAGADEGAAGEGAQQGGGVHGEQVGIGMIFDRLRA
jgi:hypothetical protein